MSTEIGPELITPESVSWIYGNSLYYSLYFLCLEFSIIIYIYFFLSCVFLSEEMALRSSGSFRCSRSIPQST